MQDFNQLQAIQIAVQLKTEKQNAQYLQQTEIENRTDCKE